MSEKYMKEIAKELRLIRLELEEMNGVQITDGGPKVNFKAINRQLARGNMMRSATD